MTEPIPRAPRIDATAADARSLEKLGYLEPQPVPSAPAEQPPADEPVPPPAPTQDSVDEQEAAAITAALADAGVASTAEDHAAVQALARLDPETVAAVTKWLRTKKRDPKDVK